MTNPRVLTLALLLIAPIALAGASGVATDPLAGYPEGSYVMETGDVAVPLRTPAPADYTEEVHRKVLAASVKGMGYDPVEDKEVAIQFLFIRPGSWMYYPSGCTMNFVYGTPGNYKIGSAGHCNAKDQPVTLLVNRGPNAPATPILVNIGVTEASHNNGVGDDWSVTAIRPELQAFVDTDTAVIGGPQGGAFTGNIAPATAQPIKHFGHGMVIGTGGTARAGVALRTQGSAWYADTEAIFGDSGSAVLLAGSVQYPMGQGLGVLTHLVVTATGVVAGTRSTAIPYTIANGDGDQFTPI